jgi:hypothetical protein
MISVFIGILACFEKLTISCLKYTPVHPMKGINETNNTRDFFGLVTYKLCKEEHPCTGKLAKLPQAEVVEFLRILHEDISLVIYEINDCMNPQFLCHTVVELTVLIVQWYAVIVYMAFTFKAPLASSIHVVNCFFVIMHTLGIFLFLKNAQQLKNMVSSGGIPLGHLVLIGSRSQLYKLIRLTDMTAVGIYASKVNTYNTQNIKII